MSHDHDDYAVEPIRGLPEKLPEGEHLIWQGAPSWWEMAKHTFHIRSAGIYFLMLIVWRASVHTLNGTPQQALVAALSLLPIALAGLGLLGLLAWLCSRTSVYTITNRRIVMRIGVALPTAINIPFSVIGAAGLRRYASGAGDIHLSLFNAGRMAYSNLWPHVRPWHFANPEPMLRGIPKAVIVAQLLGDALAATATPQASAFNCTSVKSEIRSERPVAALSISGAHPA